MIKFLIIGVFVASAGALGYFGERFLRPTQPPGPQDALGEKKALLFKLPLGRFTMQLLQPRSTLHLVFDIDVYVMGSGAFQDINGAGGRARLRDATVTAIAELAETDLSLGEPMDEEERKKKLAAQIVRKLYVNYPVIRTAQINSYKSNLTLRE